MWRGPAHFFSPHSPAHDCGTHVAASAARSAAATTDAVEDPTNPRPSPKDVGPPSEVMRGVRALCKDPMGHDAHAQQHEHFKGTFDGFLCFSKER